MLFLKDEVIVKKQEYDILVSNNQILAQIKELLKKSENNIEGEKNNG